MNTPKVNLAGISKENRNKLSLLIRTIASPITTKEASRTLKMQPEKTSRLLMRFANCGWLCRIKRGVYIPLSLESNSAETVIEDAWTIADKLYAPCYIGGWSALEHWGLTEQIFSTNIVITAKKVRNLSADIKGTKFLIKVTYLKNLFGLKKIWRGSTQVQVSDPSRTIIDLLDDPSLGGGIRPAFDALKQYLRSSHKNLKLLVEYGDKLGNRTIFKRLGFLLEYIQFPDADVIEICKSKLSAGNSKLDPALSCDRLIKAWRLWVPQDWKNKT